MAARGGRSRDAQGLLTILFTDLEASTAMTQRLGDARAQAIVRAHNAIVRRELAARGGKAIKHTGDGIMATFPSAARAVAAAVAMQRATLAHNAEHQDTAFNIAIGLNAGEPVAEDADVFGSAVQLAKRTCDQARGGQILATNVVRELVYGKGAVFADIGSAELKGFDEPVHLFEVSAGAAGIDEGQPGVGRGLPLRWVLAATAVAGIAVAGGAAGVLTLAGGDSGGAAQPAYRVVRIRQNQSNQPFEITGDCIETPVRLTGHAEGPFTGDIGGVSRASYEVYYSLDDDCTSLSLRALGSSDLNDGSTFKTVAAGFSLNVLGVLTPGSATSQADIVLAQMILDGTGVYAGVAGRGTCFVTALRNQVAGQEGISYENECTYKLAPISSLPPVIVQPLANTARITTQLSPSGRADTFKVLLLYFNTTDEVQSQLSASLPAPPGTRMAMSVGQDAPSESVRQWPLPDLQPGEVASVEVTVRLLEAEGTQIELMPEVRQGGRPLEDSEPIAMEVER